MSWFSSILEQAKWKVEDVVWSIQDKYTFWKELRCLDKELDQVEEIEAKPKKKKNKKKSRNGR